MQNCIVSVSDIINIVAVVVSLFVGIVSIIIAVKTLRQNSRMIEESNRPYVTVYSNYTMFQSSVFYIIVKNFGNTGAVITKFEYDIDFSELSVFKSNNNISTPFSHLAGSSIAPGQTYVATLFGEAIAELRKKNVTCINFLIEYSTSSRKFKENISLQLSAYDGLLVSRSQTHKGSDKELNAISRALRALYENQI